MSQPDEIDRPATISIWKAMRAYSGCPVCGATKPHRAGCEFLKKKAIGFFVVLGIPIALVMIVTGNIAGLVGFVLFGPLLTWWYIAREARRSSYEQPPSESPQQD